MKEYIHLYKSNKTKLRVIGFEPMIVVSKTIALPLGYTLVLIIS